MDIDVVNELINTNKAIEQNISNLNSVPRWLLSHNVLNDLRTLVEDIIVLFYNKNNDLHLSISFQDKKLAYRNMYSARGIKFLKEIHSFLQVSKSHYTPNMHGDEMLLQKYVPYMYQLRDYVKKEFKLNILSNIDSIQYFDDDLLKDYYGTIHDKLYLGFPFSEEIECAKLYYVEKQKIIPYNGDLFYELTLSEATDNYNKFDRVVVYSKKKIISNYSIRFSYIEEKIELFENYTTVKFLTSYRIAIRPCEINKMFRIFDLNYSVRGNMVEYNNIMNYMTINELDLLDLTLLPQKLYLNFKEVVTCASTNYILDFLDLCRSIILDNRNGSNIIRYLLYKPRHNIITSQLNYINGKFVRNQKMSNMCISKYSYPFEKMPYLLSLINHSPNFGDIIMCIDYETLTDEKLIARTLYENVEYNGILYTPIENFSDIKNLDELIDKFNKELYGSQKKYTIIKNKDFLYMEGYEKSTIEILKKINSYTKLAVQGYSDSYKYFEKSLDVTPDISEEKRTILRDLFSDSHIAIIYGSAGTGKTTMLKHICDFFSNQSVVLLSNTNSAVDNLKKRIPNFSNSCYTIKHFLNISFLKHINLLIVDECSTVSNDDMLHILSKQEYDLIVLAGDEFQIESIKYGNWFNYCKNFINKNSVHLLKETFRSSNSKLLDLWDIVRNRSNKIHEYISKYNYSSVLGHEIFSKQSEDEIILCLGYDGPYGINQINKYLQDSNHNKEHSYGIKTYKVGDPIIFFDTKRYGDVLYNNLKGKIIGITDSDKSITFEIEVFKPLLSIGINTSDIAIISTSENSSQIRISINKDFDADEDDYEKNSTVPFNVAYAVSVHKAQGLEYDSVKVVLTKDIENLITLNIFYTAITRSKNELKIFWTPDTANSILNNIQKLNDKKDYWIFKNKFESELKTFKQ